MKPIARTLLALALTMPIYAGITAIPALAHWFNSGSGWDTVGPLFRALGSEGGEQNDDYLFGSLLLVSFVIALVTSSVLVSGFSRIRDRSRKPGAAKSPRNR
jgi:hypothetical protein